MNLNSDSDGTSFPPLNRVDQLCFPLDFPNEILDTILGFILAQKAGFSSIASFTLASTRFRQIALRRYFFSLSLKDGDHLIRLHRLLIAQGEQAFAWVR